MKQTLLLTLLLLPTFNAYTFNAFAQEQIAPEFEDAETYGGWVEQNLPLLSQHSSQFELDLHAMKFVTNRFAAEEIIEQARSRGSPEELSLLVAAAPDTTLDPLLKRLLLGTAEMPTNRLTERTVYFFSAFAEKINCFKDEKSSKKKRLEMLDSLTDQLRRFQNFVGEHFKDEARSTDYMKSILRIMLTTDRDMRRWLSGIIDHGRHHLPRNTIFNRIDQSPFPATIISAACLIIPAAATCLLAHLPWTQGLIGFFALVGMGTYSDLHTLQNEGTGTTKLTRKILEEKKLLADQKKILEELAPSCNETFKESNAF